MKLNLEDSFSTVVPNRMAKIALAPDTPVFTDYGVNRLARLLHPDCLALTAGACTLCARCTCPTRPCRYPSKRLTSMEAYGLWVSDICQKSGLAYNYGPQTLTYTSCVLIAEE